MNKMKKIKAEIVADSINSQGDRITTYILTFPRFILAELNTHRVFSKNSASSRAIPFEKMVKMVKEDPFIPIAWQKDHKGMQGSEYAQYPDTEDFKVIWLEARDNAIKLAQLAQTGRVKLTKQLCNRLLEPFMWHTVLLTGTEFENFFELRCPRYEISLTPDDSEIAVGKSWKELMNWYGTGQINAGDFDTENIVERLQYNKGQAEIHMQALAEAMYDAYNESTPKELKEGEWHIPFGDKISDGELRDYFYNVEDNPDPSFIDYQETKLKISTARCARLSYMTFDGKVDYEKDIKLHDTLLESHHASPFEHCCRVLTKEEYNILGKMVLHPENGYVFENGWVDNFKGFISYRRILNI